MGLRIKLPGNSNLLGWQGRRKAVEDAVVVMRSLEA